MVQLYARSAGEALANTVTQGFQAAPRITRLSSGGYVVVWSDSSQLGADTSNYGVKAQIYDPNGSKVGGEFQVNATTFGRQTVDSVAATPDGGFVAVYLTENQAIRAQRFDSSGAAMGGELLVTASVPSAGQINRETSVTVLTNGSMIVTWMKFDPYSGPNYGHHIFAKAFNAATGAALGGEFRLDSVTNDSSTPSNPSVAALASGGWIATWTNNRHDDSEIVGQVFAANGTKVGGEFAVNTASAGHQVNPAVTALAGGGFAIAWGDGHPNASKSLMRAQVFTDSGVKVGGEIAVGSATYGSQSLPRIDRLAGGGFVVTWSDGSFSAADRDGLGIMARVFDSSGAPVGDQFLVNSVTAGSQEVPVVAGLASGGFVIAWNGPGLDEVKTQLFTPLAGGATDIALSTASVREAATGNYAVATLSDNGGVNSGKTYSLLADSTGGGFRIEGDRLVIADNSRLDHETAPTASLTIRVTDVNGNSHEEVLSVAITDSVVEDRYSAGPEFHAPASAREGHFSPALGQLVSGGYVMAWTQSFGDGSGLAVKAQIFDDSGAKVGAEIVANSTLGGDQYYPAVAGLRFGGFVIVWEDVSGTAEAAADIRGQRFDSAGAKVGGEFTVNTLIAGDQTSPEVTELASGGFVVTWTDLSGSTQHDLGRGDVRGQVYDAAGSKLGAEFLVNTNTVQGQYNSSVEALPTGGFIVAWTDAYHSNVAVQRFDQAGNKVGGEIHVGSLVTTWNASAVAVLESGGFVVSWSGYSNESSSDDIRAQIFGADGSALGGSFRVNTETASFQTDPSIVALPWGGFVISWTDNSGKGGDPFYSGTRAQMYDSTGAKIGEEFVVNASTDGAQSGPVSTVLESGGFVIGWTDTLYNPSPASTIEGRVFSLSYAETQVLNGDDSDNVIHGGGGNDVVYGLGGADRLDGGRGKDQLDGGGGDDVLIGGAGDDSYAGGDGVDTVDFSGEAGPVKVNLHPASNFSIGGAAGNWSLGPGQALDSFGNYEALSGVENLVLTAGDDHAQGSDGANRIEAGAGEDYVEAGEGNDMVLGGAGNDVVYAAGGEDTVLGGEGIDFLYMGGGDDTALAGAGNDMVWGQNGADRLEGEAGNDTLRGEEGNDFVDGGSGDDSVYGGADNDVVHGGDGEDFVRGDDGDDQLFGGSGSDNMRGGRGVDSFDGGSGGEWTDTFRGPYGDKVSFYEQSATQAAVADLRTGIISNDGFGNSETMVNIESLGSGTAFADTFYGNDAVNGLLGSIGDFVHGLGGDDRIELDGAVSLVDGGDGIDTIRLQLSGALILPNASGHADFMDDMTAGWKVDLAAGTLRDGYGNSGSVAGVENVAGSELADDLRGSALDNRMEGGGGSDLLRLQDGGDDTVLAGAGSDSIFFIGSLTAADVVNGGEGTDTLILQGPYGALALTANVTLIENISILGGNNVNFGEPGTNRYDYVLTTHDSNFAAGVQARINGAALLAGEDFAFDGSAETNAHFVVYGGKGKDSLTGGLGNDIFFYAEERFASGDTVNGGAGYDGMFLRGNYTIDFNAPGFTGLFTNIENLTLTSATDERYARGGGTEFDYNLTLSNAIVGAGQTLTISGSLLLATESMVLDASQESDGLLRLFGGKASDTLKGGALNDLIHGNLGADILAGNGGADAFRYQDVAESTAASMDQILDFTAGTDRIELDRIDANAGAVGDQAFSWIGSGPFTGTAGQLRAYEQNGTWFVEGDTNGDSVADLVIALTLQGQTPLVAGDFIL